MNWLRHRLSRISLIAIWVMVMAAVAPTISQVLPGQSTADAVANFGKGPLQICSIDGLKQISGPGGDSRPEHQASKGHCPFCHLQSQAILDGRPAGYALARLEHSRPVESRSAQRHAPVGPRLPPSRAPPPLTPVV